MKTYGKVLIFVVVLILAGLAYGWYRGEGANVMRGTSDSSVYSITAPEPYVSVDISREMGHPQVVFVQPVALQAAKANPLFATNPFLAFLDEQAAGMSLQITPATISTEEDIKGAIPLGASPGKADGTVTSFTSKEVGDQTFYMYTVTYSSKPPVQVDGVLWFSKGKLYELRDLDSTNPVGSGVLTQTATSFKDH